MHSTLSSCIDCHWVNPGVAAALAARSRVCTSLYWHAPWWTSAKQDQLLRHDLHTSSVLHQGPCMPGHLQLTACSWQVIGQFNLHAGLLPLLLLQAGAPKLELPPRTMPHSHARAGSTSVATGRAAAPGHIEAAVPLAASTLACCGAFREAKAGRRRLCICGQSQS